jgi:transcriptional regulator with XRE-family HTH domain
MTQRALAAMAHVWQTTVCRLERGTQPLTGEVAWLFADLLGTSVDDLVGRRAGHEAWEGETG